MAATKRAFNNQVIISDDFLQLSSTAQNLYFFLNLLSDDEGFNGSPRAVMDMCKAADADLAQLIGKGYVVHFESGVVVVRHWLIHNNLTRPNPTIYEDEKYELGPGKNGEYERLEVLPSKAMSLPTLQRKLGKSNLTMKDLKAGYAYSINAENGFDNLQLPEIAENEFDNLRREGKGNEMNRREGEISVDGLYGQYRNVFLLPDQFIKICNEYKNPLALIQRVDDYLQNTERVFNSHFNLIQKIAREDKWAKKDNDTNSIKEKKETSNTDSRYLDELIQIMNEYGVDRTAAEKIYEKECEDAKQKVMAFAAELASKKL